MSRPGLGWCGLVLLCACADGPDHPASIDGAPNPDAQLAPAPDAAMADAAPLDAFLPPCTPTTNPAGPPSITTVSPMMPCKDRHFFLKGEHLGGAGTCVFVDGAS